MKKFFLILMFTNFIHTDEIPSKIVKTPPTQKELTPEETAFLLKYLSIIQCGHAKDTIEELQLHETLCPHQAAFLAYLEKQLASAKCQEVKLLVHAMRMATKHSLRISSDSKSKLKPEIQDFFSLGDQVVNIHQNKTAAAEALRKSEDEKFNTDLRNAGINPERLNSVHAQSKLTPHEKALCLQFINVAQCGSAINSIEILQSLQTLNANQTAFLAYLEKKFSTKCQETKSFLKAMQSERALKIKDSLKPEIQDFFNLMDQVENIHQNKTAAVEALRKSEDEKFNTDLRNAGINYKTNLATM